MRYKVIYKPFGRRSRQIRIIEVEADRPHEPINEIMQINPLAEIVGVFRLEEKLKEVE